MIAVGDDHNQRGKKEPQAILTIDHFVSGGGKRLQRASGADVVVTMLPAGKHVREVYQASLVDTASSGSLLIDCSTIDVASARAVAEHAGATGSGQAAKICNNMLLGATMIATKRSAPI